MTTFIDIDADHVVGINVDGKITGQEFDALTALMEKKMQDHEKVSLYIELTSFEGFSAEAFFKDVKFALSNLDRFEKEALVTDRKWVQKVSTLGDVFTKVEI
jgi:hypothetical protein